LQETSHSTKNMQYMQHTARQNVFIQTSYLKFKTQLYCTCLSWSLVKMEADALQYIRFPLWTVNKGRK